MGAPAGAGSATTTRARTRAYCLSAPSAHADEGAGEAVVGGEGTAVGRPLTSQERAAEQAGARPGRPTKVGPGLAGEVARLVAAGLTLREAAARAGVHPRTVLRRAAADPAFRARYAEARALALEALLGELRGLARAGASPREVADARRRLMRRAPKRHGRPGDDRNGEGELGSGGRPAGATSRTVKAPRRGPLSGGR